MVCNRSPDIGESDMSDFAGTNPVSDNRHSFTRVITSRPGRIVAVVGRNQGQIARNHAVEKARQFGVEPFQRPRIAGNVIPMSIFAVEFDEIGENQTAVLGGP